MNTSSRLSTGLSTDLMPRSEAGWSLPLALAMGVHLLLVLALTWGVDWKSHEATQPVFEAELWRGLPAAAPAPAAPAPPPPAPRPPKEAKPTEPSPATPPPPPPAPAAKSQPAQQAQPTPKRPAATAQPADRPRPDIAERQAKEKAVAQAKADAQAQNKASAKAAADAKAATEAARAKKAATAAKAAETAKQEAAKAQAKAAAEQKAAEVKKAQAAKERLAAEAKKAEAEKARLAAQAEEAAEKEATANASRAAELRAEQLKRMAQQAGGPTPGASQGPSSGYVGKVAAAIKGNIVWVESAAGNPRAEVDIRLTADGSIQSRRLVKSSGSPAWDEAALRAIDRTARLPRDTDGRVPSAMLIVLSPQD